MAEVAIIVPVLGRPEHAATFMESLRANTPKGTYRVVVVCSQRSDAQVWSEYGLYVPLNEGIVTFAEKCNWAYRNTTEPWLFFCGSDVTFESFWLQPAQKLMAKGFKVIGTNDKGNRAVMAGDHATHMFVERGYIDSVGASWDGPGVVFHEYRHNFCDTELVMAAKMRGVWSPCLRSIVRHNHHLWNSSVEHDDVYKLGEASWDVDAAEFTERVRKNTDLLTNAEA